MDQKIFQVVVALFLAVFTLAAIVFLFMALGLVVPPSQPVSNGIGSRTGGVSGGLIRLVLLDFPIVVVGIYLLWRRSKLRR
jgi:hypothetical protein